MSRLTSALVGGAGAGVGAIAGWALAVPVGRLDAKQELRGALVGMFVGAVLGSALGAGPSEKKDASQPTARFP